MSRTDCLAELREIRLTNMRNRNWVLFSRHVSPHLYDTIQHEASKAGDGFSELHHMTIAEEATPLILEHGGMAFLRRKGAWRVAGDGITMRPLVEENIRLVTSLAVSADSKSRLIHEFVKATARRLESLRKPVQP